MPQKKRSRRSEPKLFRCTGFGDCNMVFTRSEHLARHARKHTGEKPFKCIVPGCERMFSRFDNMMQHTHTHDRQKKKNNDKGPSTRTTTTTTTPPSLASSPPTHNEAHVNATMLQSRTLPPPSRPHDDPLRSPPKYGTTSSSSLASPPSPMMTLPPPPTQQPNWHPAWQGGSSGPLLSPYSPTGHTSLTDYFAQPEGGVSSSASSRRPSWNYGHQNDFWQYHPPTTTTDYWSQFRYPSPTSYRQPSPTKQQDNQSTPSSSPQPPPKRRLSLIDLQTPIDHWQERSSSSGGATSDEDNDDTTTPVVDVTPDEYEAIQGFGKFHAKSVVKFDSPHMGVQLHAFRQHTLPVPESFQRPAAAAPSDWVA
ncbi:hypothetical protein RO3G_13206 [Lichtheimia corymbifera JMRC:FSU:9682]|uniref:C2H2-type domain-containing protein n=1 Tax=Lichtheimia corymbifera JMRC:FSU:9682 TaxID=1263082 RepID=A0A068SC50_9FUNG|nr:hypothetical protein RO3G_13206 [Lichtheimia corymbifera JMRC:FSU:9682]